VKKIYYCYFLESRSAGGFFKNKFVDTLLFLDEFQLKDSSEKQSFFKSLQSNLDLFPDEIAKFKILPKLIHVTFQYVLFNYLLV
jgi:SCY1-like protein 1